MCIRDRYRGAGVDSRVYIDDEGGKLGNGAEASKNGEWQTVSTTFTATSEGYNFRLVANALAKGEIAISYTHLDVYKRQSWRSRAKRYKIRRMAEGLRNLEQSQQRNNQVKRRCDRRRFWKCMV